MLYTKTVILPDNRTVYAVQYGYMESDVNAFVETGDMELTWKETDEELTEEELHEVMPDGSYLYEWINAHGEWCLDDSWPDDDALWA